METKEYIVSLNRGVDYDQFWNEIENESPVDGFTPSRRVEIVNNRDISLRQCHYALTDEEAATLRNDPRIYDVELPTSFKPVHLATQSGNFTKTSTSSGNNINWGLRRCISETNVYGTNVSVEGNYNYTLDGSDVDIVIQDGGIQADHPEFLDANGVSRVQQIDWYAAAGLWTPSPSGGPTINLKTAKTVNVTNKGVITFQRDFVAFLSTYLENQFGPAMQGAALLMGANFYNNLNVVYAGTENNGRSYRVRFEGTTGNALGGMGGTDPYIWEVTFTDSNDIQVLIVQHSFTAYTDPVDNLRYGDQWGLNATNSITDPYVSYNMKNRLDRAYLSTESISYVFLSNSLSDQDHGKSWSFYPNAVVTQGTPFGNSNWSLQLVNGEWDYINELAVEGGSEGLAVLGTGVGDPNTPSLERVAGQLIPFNLPFDFYVQGTELSPFPENHYQDTDGHGTHVAGIAAGKTYGWAKNANIYAVKVNGLDGGEGGGLDSPECFDVIIGWHNAKTNNRPTIVNMSWGYVSYFQNITGGNYRGTPWTGNARQLQYGMIGSPGNRHAVRVNYIDVSIQEMIDAGIHVCIAAGNSYQKVDVPGGLDYDNYYTRSDFSGNFYYHQGSSPFDDQAFIVGAAGSLVYDSNTEQKASYSESGPGVDIYAPGSNIRSCTSNISSFFSESYFLNSEYEQLTISGTSMAAPQVAGIGALFLQLEPTLSPAQLKDKVIKSSTAVMHSTGLDNDYTVQNSIKGGQNRFLYNPFNSAESFRISGGLGSNSGLN